MSDEVYASDWRSRIPVISSCFLPGSLGKGGVLFHLQDLKVRDNQLQNQSTHLLNFILKFYGTSKKIFLPCEGVSHGHRIPIPADRGFGGEKSICLHGLAVYRCGYCKAYTLRRRRSYLMTRGLRLKYSSPM